MKIKNISGGPVEMKNGSIAIKAGADETIDVDAKQAALGLGSGLFEMVEAAEPELQAEEKPAGRRR